MDTVFPVMSTKEKDSLSICLFGNRLQGDQTLGEYLLEFLLVFRLLRRMMVVEILNFTLWIR